MFRWVTAFPFLVAGCAAGAPSATPESGALCRSESECDAACSEERPAACYALLFLHARGEAGAKPEKKGPARHAQHCRAKKPPGSHLIGAGLA